LAASASVLIASPPEEIPPAGIFFERNTPVIGKEGKLLVSV
jgi:hypothetical protein